MNSYLIPANTKKGQLILGIFKPFDLILFGTGCCITLLFLIIIPMSSTAVTIIVLLPALVTGFLVVPVPNYHNIRCVLTNIYKFYFVERQQFTWKGWCVKDEYKD